MKFGIGTGRNQTINAIRGQARLAEDLGFDHITFIDSQNLSRDVYAMMTIAASETSRIRIGHGVTNPFTRHWTVTANATATVNELSGGRAFLGIGAGMSSVGTLGLKARPMAMLRETVERVRAISSGEVVVLGDQEVRSEWSKGGFPVYIGSQGPKSMYQAGQIADGVVCANVDPVVQTWRRKIIYRGAAATGRDPASLPTWVRTMCFVSDSEEDARRQTRSYAATCAAGFYGSVLAHDTPETAELRELMDEKLLDDIKRIYDNYEYYEHERIDAPHGDLVTDRVIDAFLLVGPAAKIIEMIAKLEEVGVDAISMTDYTIVDKLGSMRRIASDILPHFS